MTTASDDGAKGPILCSRCGAPKPETIHHLWACCGDGPGYGDMVKPEALACVKRQLRAAESELAAERARGRELRQAGEMLYGQVMLWAGSDDWTDEDDRSARAWRATKVSLPVASVATAEQEARPATDAEIAEYHRSLAAEHDALTEQAAPPIHCISCGGSGRANAHGDCMACDGTGRAVVVSLEQAAPAAVEQPERMLGPDAKLRAEIVAAAREAGASPWPWAKFVELLEGKET
jgi:hypothetical protein